MDILLRSLDVDRERVEALVDKFGKYGAATILGYDVTHYDYLILAGRLAMQSVRDSVLSTVMEYAEAMKSVLNTPTYRFLVTHGTALDKMIRETADREMEHDWFSANTMITTYSRKLNYNGSPMEDSRYIWLRVAVQLWATVGYDKVVECYIDLLEGNYTPATPTIWNAGTTNNQMASCFLFSIEDDLSNILQRGVHDAGVISQNGGGIGYDISRVRHSEIGTQGMSDGLIPMLQLYNDTVRYCRQQSRKGAATAFLRPHHIDIQEVVKLSLPVGDRYSRAHDLQICVWSSRLFWERVIANKDWTLFCPAKTKELNDLHGPAFDKAYCELETASDTRNHPRSTIKARDLHALMLKVQRETGRPYIMNGDAANCKSNQRHLGYIRNSNLCLEIIEHTEGREIAVCNLASLSLRMFVRSPYPASQRGPNNSEVEMARHLRSAYDFDKLALTTVRVVENLNRVIDLNNYPLDDNTDQYARRNNSRHRPVGLGASGLAEALFGIDVAFESPVARLFSKMVAAATYWNALAASVNLAISDGPYESFAGSPTSEGKLQFDLWREEFQLLGPNLARQEEDDDPICPAMWGQSEFRLSNDYVIEPSWDALKAAILTFGLRNSLLIAYAPTATTAQVRRNTETLEMPQSNIFSRQVMKCSYPVLNTYLVDDLIKLGCWNSYTLEYIRNTNGSIAGLTDFVTRSGDPMYPLLSVDQRERMIYLESKYKTMWELPQKLFLQYAADRGRYVCQSQSLNIYLNNTSGGKQDGASYIEKQRVCHIWAYWLGLKTMVYYLRSRSLEVVKFTCDPTFSKYIRGLQVEHQTAIAQSNAECSSDTCSACT
jgi:ribonucleoside-diphosphate reductase alpha chain